MLDENNRSSGYVYAVLASAFWASSGVVSKFLLSDGLSPFSLVQLRTTISALSLLAVLSAVKPRTLLLKKEDVPFLVLLGVLVAAVQFTYLFAIAKIHLAAAILLEYQAPVMIALYTFFFAGKKLSPRTLFSVASAVAGCYLMVGAYNLDMVGMNKAGIASGLASAAAFAWYSIMMEKGLRTYSSWTVVLYGLLFASVVWNVLHPPFEAFLHAYGTTKWAGIIYIGICGTILPFAFYSEGIRRIGAVRTGVTATLEPVIAGTAAYFLMGETMEPLQSFGALIVISSIVLLRSERRSS